MSVSCTNASWLSTISLALSLAYNVFQDAMAERITMPQPVPLSGQRRECACDECAAAKPDLVVEKFEVRTVWYPLQR